MTPRVYEDVLDGLHVRDDNVAVKAYPPDRQNVFIDVARRSCLNADRDLAWLADMLESQQQRCPKTVIFARTINAVTELYGWLLHRLKRKAFAGDTCVAQTRMVSMFHGHIHIYLPNSSSTFSMISANWTPLPVLLLPQWRLVLESRYATSEMWCTGAGYRH